MLHLLCRLLCVLFACLLVPAVAHAQAVATIEALSAADPSGRFRAVDATGAGFVVRDGTEQGLTAGMRVEIGDRVVTKLARVELHYDNGNRLNLAEGTEITVLGDVSLRQQLGQVYYQITTEVFGVEYQTVEATVEGTRFLVLAPAEADGPVVVQVEEGVVRVTNDAGNVALTRGSQVAMPLAGAVGQSARFAPAFGAYTATWLLGRPRLEVRALATGHALALGERDNGADVGLRVGLGLHLLPVLRVTWDGGYARTTGTSHRLPQGLGFELQPPGAAFSMGAQYTVTYEDQGLDCGLQYRAVHFGGSANARYRFTLSRRLSVLGEVNAGYDDKLAVGGALGVGVGL